MTILQHVVVSALLTTLVAGAATPTVEIGVCGRFAILAKTGITNVPSSVIVGDMGVSPIASAAITGFALILDAGTTYSTSTQVTGSVFAASYTSPTPSKLTTAISNMQTAYTDAAGRATSGGANLDVLGGLISGATFSTGVYTWGTSIDISSSIYINGSSTDVFIFQSAGNMVVGAGAQIILVDDGSGNGLPQPSNIFWQVAGHVDAGAGSHLEGVLLVKTHAAFKASSSLNGRILTQTAATLVSTTVTAPADSGEWTTASTDSDSSSSSSSSGDDDDDNDSSPAIPPSAQTFPNDKQRISMIVGIVVPVGAVLLCAIGYGAYRVYTKKVAARRHSQDQLDVKSPSHV